MLCNPVAYEYKALVKVDKIFPSFTVHESTDQCKAHYLTLFKFMCGSVLEIAHIQIGTHQPKNCVTCIHLLLSPMPYTISYFPASLVSAIFVSHKVIICLVYICSHSGATEWLLTYLLSSQLAMEVPLRTSVNES